MSTRRTFASLASLASLAAVAALGSATIGVSLAAGDTGAANSSHLGKTAAVLIETAASGPAPSTTIYDQ